MSHILTYPTRSRVSLLDPDPSTIHIEDVAWALAKECRFANNIAHHYSVAEHCVYVSRLVDAEHGLRALLHDGSEYILRDFPKPAKNLCPDYERLERRVQAAVYRAFGLDPENERSALAVKVADRAVFSHEDVILREMDGELIPGLAIQCWPRAVAQERFMERFHELKAS